MPLLKKKPFEKAAMPTFLRDDEEVFFCAATNEIFRDYEDFSERMFLCNSMVWTCSLTGKANLTYAEALESEENARKNLKGFPAELKTPILYLAGKTKRTAFGDMAEDVFTYAKDRYFIGENVETSFTETKWKDSHVLQVIAPSSDNIKVASKNGNVENYHHHPPAALYKYEIEHLDADDEDISEIMIVDYNQIRRKKGMFSRERCKLFLKQHVEQNDKGVFVIKLSTVESYNLNRITFEQIFDGPLPEFDASKKFGKMVNGKKTRQESLHKFLTKSNNDVKNGNNIELLEKIKKREEEYKLHRQQKKEREMALKQKKKEENMLLSKHFKDWYKPKEDLELTDQKKLPIATPVKTNVPDEYFGDMIMVLEFVNSFSKLLSPKDFFPGGLTIEIMERALTKNEVAGPLIDLIQMLLTALFNVQDEEASQYKTEIENPSSIKQEDTSDNMNLREATRLATIASSWSKKYQGLPLSRLPLYSLTTSEILRLHLLGSGAIINFTGAKWRYQQRGGYTSEDDPGLYLRLHSPHILKALGVYNVVQLSISDKLNILSCLINQLLTYADVRDIVEERMYKVRQAKIDYKLTLAAQKRLEQEFLAAKYKLKKSDESNLNLSKELDKLEMETKKKKDENERKIEEFRKSSYDKEVVMGQDRALRQYLKLESVPGFFVNFEEKNPGICLNSVIKQNPNLVNATRDETLAHIKKLLQETNSSDKENSPSKNPKKLNGTHNLLMQQCSDSCDELMLCSADINNCVVHSCNKKVNKWGFYHEEEKFHELIESLNKRGVRESKLQQNLKNNRDEIEKVFEETPITSLNMELTDKEGPSRLRKINKAKYEDANLGYPSDMNPEEILHNALVDNVLEMEEKIYAGNLGSLFIKDREKWRNCLQNKNYKELDKTVIRRDKTINQDNLEKNIESNTESQDYQDPGHFLKLLHGCEPNTENNDIVNQKEEIQEAIQSLAVVLAQIAQAVDPKYLKKPLGRISSGRNDKKKENMLNMWEQSLMGSTSFSQLFLHYGTLDSCVMWGKSVLLARCRICRRQNDSENMLLCDGCNWGHHLYCLKPKLKSVPPGDWFCNKCQKERKIENVAVSEPPRKKRPIFRDEEIDEENSEDQMESDEENDDTEEDNEEDDDDEDEDAEIMSLKIEICKTCGSGGELISCEKCSNTYHIECVEPPLRRSPRGSWSCMFCKRNGERKRNYDKNYSNGAVVQRTGVMNGQRRCAAKALFKIHDFAKSLRQLSESDDSSEEEVINKRSVRREEGRTDLPLHNAALHEVLSEIMKDYNAWPFLRPVQKTEVPDYYDVITKPMDFGTIKYKLNMGEYQEDAQFMSDALLVFQNCNTYNHTEDDVYKCGVQLLKHFQKKCRELGLKLPEEMDYNDHSVRPKKKMRTK